MPRTLTQIRCPNCKSPIQAPLEQLIDAAQDPASKARLLAGTLNLVRCPVCKYEGQLATPLVYHDPTKELLLTFMPVELGLKKDEQERMLGSLINQVINHLPPEQRKGYLLQPQAILTLQGLIERILAADGITKEQIEAQRATMRLFEDLLRAPEADLPVFVAQHDAELDESFFRLASLTLQTTGEQRAQEAIARRVEAALPLTSYGRRLIAREAELRAAAESLQQAGKGLTRDKLLDLFLQASNEDRVSALASLARPGLDYAFFQALSDRIEAAQGAEKDRLTGMRQSLLEFTQEYDKLQEAHAARSASLLRSIVNAKDLDKAIEAALPLIDDLFLGLLQANITAAGERGDQAAVERLEQVDRRIREVVRKSLPPGMQLAQQVLETEDEAEAQRLLDASPEVIDEQCTGALLSTAERMQEAGETEAAERLRRLLRYALRVAMRAKMRQGSPSAPAAS